MVWALNPPSMQTTSCNMVIKSPTFGAFESTWWPLSIGNVQIWRSYGPLLPLGLARDPMVGFKIQGWYPTQKICFASVRVEIGTIESPKNGLHEFQWSTLSLWGYNNVSNDKGHLRRTFKLSLKEPRIEFYFVGLSHEVGWASPWWLITVGLNKTQ
jgi:hypothetical protein